MNLCFDQGSSLIQITKIGIRYFLTVTGRLLNCYEIINRESYIHGNAAPSREGTHSPG